MVSRKPVAPGSASASKVTATLSTRGVSDVANDAGYSQASEKIKQWIQEVSCDLRDLENFYNISISPTRVQRLGEYLAQRTNEVGIVASIFSMIVVN